MKYDESEESFYDIEDVPIIIPITMWSMMVIFITLSLYFLYSDF